MTAQSFTHPKNTPNGAGVLITGCSSGIGRATAIHLARRGFTVFAGVRKAADADDLRRLEEPNLVPICPLDLTRLEQIQGVYETVSAELSRRGLPGLYALVNNAGGGSVVPIELMDLQKFHTELQTRLLGPVALLQAFLPLIRNGAGRVVWIVTPGLIPTAYVASIHAPDFAANCLARTLALELRPWKIPSILVRCGGIETPSPARSDAELGAALKAWSPQQLELYGRSMTAARQSFSAFDAKRTPVEAVAQVVYRALAAPRPRSRYRVGYMSGMAAFLESLPQTLADRLLAMRG
jgi:NAD(P)-dependent dehydrogenase (short-subunit alcohol dehydrogenase family)